MNYWTNCSWLQHAGESWKEHDAAQRPRKSVPAFVNTISTDHDHIMKHWNFLVYIIKSHPPSRTLAVSAPYGMYTPWIRTAHSVNSRGLPIVLYFSRERSLDVNRFRYMREHIFLLTVCQQCLRRKLRDVLDTILSERYAFRTRIRTKARLERTTRNCGTLLDGSLPIWKHVYNGPVEFPNQLRLPRQNGSRCICSFFIFFRTTCRHVSHAATSGTTRDVRPFLNRKRYSSATIASLR